MKRSFVLETAIEGYIRDNPKIDSVDIVDRFSFDPETTLFSIAKLIEDRKIERVHINGMSYGYICNGKEHI